MRIYDYCGKPPVYLWKDDKLNDGVFDLGR